MKFLISFSTILPCFLRGAGLSWSYCPLYKTFCTRNLLMAIPHELAPKGLLTCHWRQVPFSNCMEWNFMINWKSGYFTCGVNYGIVFSETAVKQENNDDRLSLTLKTTLIKKDSTPDSTAFSQNTSGLRLLFSLIFFFFS